MPATPRSAVVWFPVSFSQFGRVSGELLGTRTGVNSVKQLTDLERRVAGAQGRLLAKMSEFAGWAVTDDEAGMTACRAEASALLEAFFDLSHQATAALVKRGY